MPAMQEKLDQIGRLENKKETLKIWADASQANRIATPKTDASLQLDLDAFLEHLQYIKTHKLPSGFLMDSSKIRLSDGKQYREGFEFTKTKRVLGKGICADEIIVVKDKKYDTEHALKTMNIANIRKEEIRCWVKLSDSYYVPRPYLFKLENNKVEMHMEELKDVKTLRSIIDEQVAKLCLKDPSLIKPFSLYVFNRTLEAVSDMHSKRWLHKDLHAENVMLQKESETSLQVKIIDFGLAGPLLTVRAGVRGFQADMAHVLTLFSVFELAFGSGCIQNNCKSILTNMLAEPSLLSDEEKRERLCLLYGDFNIILPADVQAYMYTVKGLLDKVKFIRSIIDLRDAKCCQKDHNPFSLYLLNGALEALSDIESKVWLHKDLHAENVMLQNESERSLQVMIIDFPLMTVTDGLDVPGFREDIAQVVRLFSALYIGQEFDSVSDIQTNWKRKLENMFAVPVPSIAVPSLLSDEDKRELFDLLSGAFKIVLPADVSAYMGTVKLHLDKAMGDQANQDDIMRKVVSLIFPSKPTDVPDSIKTSETCAAAQDTDVADSQPGDGPDMQPILDRPALPGYAELMQRVKLSVSTQSDHS